MAYRKSFPRIAILSLVLVGGCTSFISSEQATDNADGMIYYLPQPFIQVTPQNDGGVKVEVVNLPDPNHRYSVKAFSVMGNYTIDINRTEEGFLETVSFNSDGTGVLKQLIESGANLRAKEIDAKTAIKAAAKTSADEEDAKQIAATEELAKEVKDAELALQVASSKLQLLEKLKASGEAPADTIDSSIFSAKVDVDEARVKLASVETAQTNFNSSAANAGVGENPKSPEPVFFKIAMTSDSVELRRAFGTQMDRETSSLPKAPPDDPEFEVTFATGFSQFVSPDPKTKALRFNMIANKSYVNAVISEETDSTLDDAALTVWPDKRTVVIDLPKDLANGQYNLRVDYVVKKGSNLETIEKTFPFTVEK